VQKILPNGAPFAAVSILIAMFLYTSDWIAAFAIAIVWFAFESFGWGKWMDSIPYWHDKNLQPVYNKLVRDKWPNTGKSTGIHWAANMVFKEDENFINYSILALFLRGLLWFVPVYAVFAGFGMVTVPVAIVATLILGATFPMVYKISYDYDETGWYARAEHYYGFTYGLTFSGSLLLGAYGI